MQTETGFKNADLMLVDLADFTSISKFVAELEARVDRLDLLVLNAGLVPNGPKRTETTDGWESSYVEFPGTSYFDRSAECLS